MQVAQGDYIILKVADRPALAKVSAVPAAGKKGAYKATLCKEKDTAKKTVLPVEFSLNEVQANMGRHPPVGTVYGQKVEPLVKTRSSKFWEEIRIYKHLSDKDEAELVSELSAAYNRLVKFRLGNIKIELEIRQESGKYSGMYFFCPREENDIMWIKPAQNFEGMRYDVYHEYGHGVWYRMMKPSQRLAWVKLYHEYVGLQEVTAADLEEIREEVEAAGSINAFVKAADEQTQLIFKAAMRQISQVHGLGKKHLDLAITQGESIEDFWPVNLELSEKEVIVTDYARKNPEELFAESFAHHVAGRKIPKKIQELLDLTLSKLSKPIGAQVATKRDKPEDGDKKSSKKSKRKSGLK